MGFFYSTGQLLEWQHRAIYGPYKTNGDAFTNSPGDWDRMKNNCITFINSDAGSASMIWNGLTVPADEYDDPLTTSPLGQVDGPIFGHSNASKYVRMMEAAFVDLVQGTNLYKPTIKNVMLTQAQKPGVDFTDSYLYPTTAWGGNTDISWTIAVWVMKFLKAYDYMGEDYFTAGERTIMRTWFKNAADWFYYLSNNRALALRYVTRGVPIENYQLIDNTISGTCFRSGPNRWAAGAWHNNRRWGQISFVAHVGVLLNDQTLWQHGLWAVKEWLAFNITTEGYNYELQRSLPTSPQQGLGYTPSTTSNAIAVAIALYLNGKENLFDYSTNVYLRNSDGVLMNDGPTKTLKWAITQHLTAVMISPTAPAIYPNGSVGTSTDILMHYCLSTVNSSQWRHRCKPASPATMVNTYYHDADVKNVYFPGGGLCGFPSNPNPEGAFNAWNGADGQYVGYMFQYADTTLGSAPSPDTPPPPQPDTSMRGWTDESIVRRRFR